MLLSLLLLSWGAAGLDGISVLVVEDVTVALVGVVAVDVELVEAFTITLVVAVGGVKLADVSLRSLSFATTWKDALLTAASNSSARSTMKWNWLESSQDWTLATFQLYELML
jgi:hypothetical protein